MVTLLNWTLVLAWYISRLVVKNGCQNNMCYNWIGLCAQKIETILGSIVNVAIGRASMTT